MHPADRDQTKTEETASLAHQFLEREMFATYKKEVMGILTQCYDRIFESESRICTFYAQKNRKVATQKRLSSLRGLLAKAPELEARLIAFEGDVALMMGDTVLAEQKRTELKDNFPDVHEHLAQAPRKSFSHRF